MLPFLEPVPWYGIWHKRPRWHDFLKNKEPAGLDLLKKNHVIWKRLYWPYFVSFTWQPVHQHITDSHRHHQFLREHLHLQLHNWCWWLNARETDGSFLYRAYVFVLYCFHISFNILLNLFASLAGSPIGISKQYGSNVERNMPGDGKRRKKT